jgi:hypothetical protein
MRTISSYILDLLHIPLTAVEYTADWDNSDKLLVVIPQGGISELGFPDLPLVEIEGVPLLFGEPRVERQDGKLIIYADIIASAFFLLSRAEEILRRDVRDQHGRFPGKESLPYRAGFIDRPIVDEYGRLLRKWLREAGIDAQEPERRFKVSLTHDVDIPWRYARPVKAVMEAALGRRGKRDGLRALTTALHLQRDPADTFDLMRRIDNYYREKADHEVEIIYFFMAGGTSRFDGRYDIRDKRVKKLIKALREDGAVIGLHPSYEAGGNPELIAQEKAILEDTCGFEVKYSRHHYLRMREPEHISYLEDAGIEHDYTLGYADHIGFRCGTCQPFHPWDFNKNCPSKVLCHPLMIMECSLQREAYMELNYDDAKGASIGLLEQVKQFMGESVLLWHNTAFVMNNYQHKLYNDILKYL